MIPQEYFNKVKKYYNNDEKKTWEWFQTGNGRFGAFSPLNLIKLGKHQKVIDFIDKNMK